MESAIASTGCREGFHFLMSHWFMDIHLASFSVGQDRDMLMNLEPECLS